MPRKPRGAPQEETQEKAKTTERKRPPANIVTKVRVRCPVCGMLPEVERITDHDPYVLEVFEQKFGGSSPAPAPEGPSKHRRSRKGPIGYMEYIPLNSDVQEDYKQYMIKRLEATLAELKGEA